MRISLIAATLAAVLGMPCGAYAADLYTGSGGLKDGPLPVLSSSDIINSNNEVGVAFATTGFDYLETSNGKKLDSENNWVPGVSVSASVMNNWLVNNFYFRAEYTYLDGTTDYVGALQGNPYGSLKRSDAATVNDLDFRLGKGFDLQQNVMVTPYLGIGYHDWYRGLSYKEEYTDGYWGAGLMLQWSPINRFVFTGNALVGSTFDSAMHSWDTPNAISVSLGDSATYRLGLSGDYALTRSIHLNAGVEFVDFSYAKSPWQANGYREPDSTTQNTTVKVGAAYAFGSGYEPLK